MKKLITVILVFSLIKINFAQKEYDHKTSVKNLKCNTCHSCDVPTKNNPCLYPCPRYLMPKEKISAQLGPDILTINKIKAKNDFYKPVIFSHRLHSEMSDMSGGCETCHHYNPTGKILKCSDCHSENRVGDDIHKPDLKGAYHQQCMNCHKEWSHEIECNSCHKTNKVKDEVKKEYSKKKHLKVETPIKKVYKTGYKNGMYVTFWHTDHSTLFKQECTDCHNNSSCVSCHDKKPEITKAKKNTDKHQKCNSCHNTKLGCETCHKNSESKGFNHFARTGFELKGAHLKLSCNDCHLKPATFKGLNKKCDSCHNNCTQENFDHKVTGLVLDDNHKEAECTDCHTNKDYTKRECNNCHEDFSYPKQKPGKLIR